MALRRLWVISNYNLRFNAFLSEISLNYDCRIGEVRDGIVWRFNLGVVTDVKQPFYYQREMRAE